MSDGMDTPGMTTNGSGRAAGPDAPERPDDEPRSFSNRSVEERLDALMSTVQTWDWRAAPARSRPPAAREPAQPAVARSTAEREVPPRGPAEVPAVPRVAEVPPVSKVPSVSEPHVEASPAINETQMVPVVAAASALSADAAREADIAALHAPSVADLQPADVAPVRSGDGSAPLLPVLEVEPEAVSDSPDGAPVGPLRRAWSHRTAKMAVLGVVAVVAVVAIIWGIRMAHTNPGSDTPPSTTARSASTQPSHTAFVLPVTTAQLTQYEQYAQGLQKGNAAATKVFVSSGNTPTAAQLTAPVAAYRTAVNLYDFDLRFIQWPSSMAAAIAADHTQLEVLVSFLQTYATAGTANITGWLSGLHIRGGAAQTTDNQVRQDLGLPALSSFP
jgi:hypothetical protein